MVWYPMKGAPLTPFMVNNLKRSLLAQQETWKGSLTFESCSSKSLFAQDISSYSFLARERKGASGVVHVQRALDVVHRASDVAPQGALNDDLGKGSE